MALIRPPASVENTTQHRVPVPVLLATIGRVAMRRLDEALEPSGLRPRHIVALESLRAGPQLQSALGEAAAVDPTKLVGLLNDLEEAGLVTRTRDPEDRRRHIVEISDLGRTRLAAADAAAAAVEEHFVAGLDPAERSALEALLHRLAANTEVSACSAAGELECDS